MVPLCLLQLALLLLPLAHCEPRLRTELGTAVGKLLPQGVERYGGIPYAVPPVGPLRFTRATVDERPWPKPELDARRPGAPCIQNPLGDPRSEESESPAPSEDCLRFNLWRPAEAAPPRPMMVWLFGGGLCTGFAGNEYYSGAGLAARHGVVVASVQYRLGALGFAVDEDGSGGMNGIYDVVVALRWLARHAAALGGDAGEITLFGQSSGGYATCTLCVTPAAKGLFKRASLLSGPCLGGPPGRGWGPMSTERGRNVTQQILRAHGVQSLAELKALPADQVQWPAERMNDPYFSGYFHDATMLPMLPEQLWRRGQQHVQQLMVSFTSKDGTAAYYGTSPALGDSAEIYERKMREAWGAVAGPVLQRYPFGTYGGAAATFIQADADAFVICPSRHLALLAARAGTRTWVSEYAHFQPSLRAPKGCEGQCEGWGCDNGVELGVVAGQHGNSTRAWATHGSEFKFLFGTQSGPDGVGPPNNVTYCDFHGDEQNLSAEMMARWATFAKQGEPNPSGLLPWSELGGEAAARSRMVFAAKDTDGIGILLVHGLRDEICDFWDGLFAGEATLWV